MSQQNCATLTERIRILSDKLPDIKLPWKKLSYKSLIRSKIASKIYYPRYIIAAQLWSVFGLATDYAYRAIVYMRSTFSATSHCISDMRCEAIIDNNLVDIEVRQYIKSVYTEWKAAACTNIILLDSSNIFAISWRLCIAHTIWYIMKRKSEGVSEYIEIRKTSHHIYIREDANITIIPIRVDTVLDDEITSVIWQQQLLRSISALDIVIAKYINQIDDTVCSIDLNPDLTIIDLNGRTMRADPDMYYRRCIVDFKVSKHEVLLKEHICQVLMYTMLQSLKDTSPESIPSCIVLLNPLRSNMYLLDIRTVSLDIVAKDLYDMIMSYDNL